MDVCTNGRTPSPEIMNHFSSLFFGWYLGVDQQDSQSSMIQTARHTVPPVAITIRTGNLFCFSKILKEWGQTDGQQAGI